MIVHNKHFNTYPIVFHHHGRAKWSSHYSGLLLKKKFFDQISKKDLGKFIDRKSKIELSIPEPSQMKNEINDKLTIFSVTNLIDKGSTLRCLDYYGINYSLIGENIKRFNGIEKFKEIVMFIPQIRTDYVMLMDSDDIFFIDDLKNLVRTFEDEYKCKMLFQSESWDFPGGEASISSFEESVVDGENPYKHLNSGVWIAKTDFLKSMYGDLMSMLTENNGDQPVFKRLYKKFYPDIKIDSCCKFFQSLAWSGWFEKRYPGVMRLEILDA